ncbi:hypothetical protein [Oceanospirillum maris]|uniref:hypothetical protein n=1 Tax=Oceanospirillum maris TaxID=64977 RepID=UPI000489CE47|nr:hypothetical protein [Oceanospirillum maris]
MISEITIINLQVVSAILMGYEFFISEKMKSSVDAWAKRHATSLRDSSFDEIKKQIFVIKKHIPYYVSAIVFFTLGLACFKLIHFFEAELNLIWLALILALSAIFFIVGAFNTVLDKLIIEGFRL